MKRLVLIDGNAMMHRAFHALPPLSAPDGTSVHVVYGFLSMIIRLAHDLQPTHMAVVFDRPGPTFRNELFAHYQEQRPEMDHDFIEQIPRVHDAVAAFGIPIYEHDGFEADDVIGTIVHQVRTRLSQTIDQVVIVTGDRDILQLVTDPQVMVFMPTKGLSEGKLYGEKEVMDRMLVPPSKIIDLKSLMGDASDNYPGVSGIGPKTALTLLATFGSVDELYMRLEEASISDTVKAKLVAGKESAFLGKALATIRADVPMAFDEAASRLTTFDRPQVRQVLETLHFPSLLKRLGGTVPRDLPPTKKEPTVPKERTTASHQEELF